MTPEEIKELIETTSEQIRTIVRELGDRDLILALAADSDLIYEIDQASLPLQTGGTAISSQLNTIRDIGRQIDVLRDPSSLLEVR